MNYSISTIFYLAFSLIYTKIKCSKARLIRFPIDIRGKRYIDMGNNLTTGTHCRIEAYPLKNEKVMFLGDNIQINDFVHIAARESVILGDNVLIAGKVFISDINHGFYKGDKLDSDPIIIPNERPLSSSPVEIKKNVWIGESVIVLPGVTIGEGSVVGAASVVTKDIPAYSIAVGNPAKVVKKYNFEIKKWEKHV